MKKTTIKLHTDFQVAGVDERIFGGFMEHMGRCVYEGVYDPACKHADQKGYRTDVLGALDKLKMTAMRYPGGNFASGYHWLDGIGPKENRPTMRELAWQSIETNQFGTDEYIDMCRKMGWTPMLTVNLGTGTPEEARNWVEYCNCPAGTKYADMRVANGSKEPYNVKLWCLGNEMDGKWQIGHVPAKDYAIRAQQAAKMMRDVDKSIETVVCGSCCTGLPTYISWDAEVLEHCWDFVDYVSLHNYSGNRTNNTADFLANSELIDKQLEDTAAVCRYVKAKLRSKKDVRLCFDEWNVWYKNMEMNGCGKKAPHLVEEIYNLEDAVVVAGFLNSFIRHSDTVKIANISQIVNIIAPVLTDGDNMLLQSIYYVFEMFSKRRKGISLAQAVEGGTYSTTDGRTVKYIDSSAILDGKKLSVFACNRSIDESMQLTIDVADGNIKAVKNAEMLTGKDAKDANSFQKPNVIKAKDAVKAVKLNDGKAMLKMPPLSILAATFELKA